MNKFNKMILMGLLSVATGATNVKGMGSLLEATRIGAEDSKFFVMAKPAGQDTLIEASKGNAKKDKHITKFVAVPSEVEENSTSKFFENVKGEDVICAMVTTKANITRYDQFDDAQKGKITTLYNVWKEKYAPQATVVNPVNATEIVPAKVTDTLVEAVSQILEDKNIKIDLNDPKNKTAIKALVNKCAKENPSLLRRGAKGLLILTTLATTYATLYVILGNLYYDQHCTDSSNTRMCAATSYANTAAGLAASGFAVATGYAGTQFENLKKWLNKWNVSANTQKAVAEPKLATTSTAMNPAPEQICSQAGHYEYCVDSNGNFVSGKLLKLQPTCSLVENTKSSSSSLVVLPDAYDDVPEVATVAQLANQPTTTGTSWAAKAATLGSLLLMPFTYYASHQLSH